MAARRKGKRVETPEGVRVLGKNANRDGSVYCQADGRWCHMGRVNSLRRLRLAAQDGYDSVDGTFLAYGPDKNLPRLLTYLRLADQPTLFSRPLGRTAPSEELGL